MKHHFVLGAVGSTILWASAAAANVFVDVTTTHVPTASELHALDAAFVDVDKDGDLDVILAVEGDVMPATAVGRSWSMAVGDLNGDGKDDVFIGGWGTQARLLPRK